MTPEAFAKEMAAIFRDGTDPKGTHSNADDLICELLTELGYEEGVKIFKDADKWYA